MNIKDATVQLIQKLFDVDTPLETTTDHGIQELALKIRQELLPLTQQLSTELGVQDEILGVLNKSKWWFVDKEEKSRIGIIKECEHCDKWFITRKDQPRRFCCPLCSSNASKKQCEVECAACSKKFTKPASKLKGSKSGLYFCSRSCKDESQKIGGIKEIMPEHYLRNTSPSDYRLLFTEEELFCHRCGYNEFTVSVDVHHIDGDRKNNVKSNLKPLCSNCHRALHHECWQLGE